MKFKKVEGETFKRISITDFCGDTLSVETPDKDHDFDGLWFKVGKGANGDAYNIVMVSKKDALKLAWAIVDRLSPATGEKLG